MSLPFRDRSKPLLHQLLDLVVKVPNIIADGYQMLQAPLEGSAAFDPSVMLDLILGLVDRCWTVDAELQKFYESLEKRTLGPVYWPELSIEVEGVANEGGVGKVFPVAFKFLDLKMAHVCLLYCMQFSTFLLHGLAWLLIMLFS